MVRRHIVLLLLFALFAVRGMPPQPTQSVAAAQLNTQHPRFFFSGADIATLQQRTNDPAYRPIWNQMIRYVDSRLGTRPPASAPNSGFGTFRDYGNDMISFGLACAVTEQAVYCNLAKTYLLRFANWDRWHNSTERDLALAHMLIGNALAYDWIYDELTPSERNRVRATMLREAEKMHQAALENWRGDWNNWWKGSYVQNHNWTNHAALGMVALVVKDVSTPGYDPDAWLDLAIRRLTYVRDILDEIDDGTWHESIAYQSYGLTMMLPFMVNLRRLEGIDLLPDAHLRAYGEWRAFNILPGDDEPVLAYADYEISWGDAYQSHSILRFVAAEYNDGLAEYAARAVLEQQGRPAQPWTAPWIALEFLYYDSSVAPTNPSGPASLHAPDLQAVIWRDGWENDSLIFGMISSPMGGRSVFDSYTALSYPWNQESPVSLNSGHDHRDAGTFYIYRGNRALAIEDVGFVVNGTSSHNTVLIDGEGQFRVPYGLPSLFQGTDPFTEAVASTPNYDYFATDITRAYDDTPDLTDFTRHVIYVRPGYFVMVDNLQAGSSHRYEWIVNFDGNVSSSGRWIRSDNFGWTLGVGQADNSDTSISLNTRSDPTQARIRTSNKRNHRFVHLLYPTTPGNWGNRPSYSMVRNTDGLTISRVEGDGHNDDVLIRYGPGGTSEFDGRAAVVRRTGGGELEGFFIFEGTSLDDPRSGIPLMRGLATDASIEIGYSGNVATVDGDLGSTDTFTIWGPDVTQVLVNGGDAPFTDNGDTVTVFGSGGDFVAPSVQTLSPADDATDVLADPDLVLTFDELVQVGVGNVTIFNADDTTFEQVDITTATFDGTAVTVPLGNDFVSEASYYVQIDDTAIGDAFGNFFAGIADNTTWNFTVRNLKTPVLEGVTPTHNSTDVAVDVNLVLDFDEPVGAGAGNIRIYEAVSDGLVTSIPASNATYATDRVTVNPPSDLDSETEYYVLVDDDAIINAFDNPFEGISDTTAWSFTTADVDGPQIVALNPADGSTGVDVNTDLTVAFDENIQVGSGNIVIYDDTDTAVETIDVATATIGGDELNVSLAASLDGDADYYVQIDAGAVEDLGGNSFGGINNETTWNFTTIDGVPPQIVSLTPANGSPMVPVDSDLTVVFDEPVQAATGNITVFDDTDTAVETVAVGDATVNDDTLTVSLTNPLVPESDFYVQIDAGAVEDLSGNAFAGITDTMTWAFTTEDTTAPTLTTLNPADDSTDVAIATDLVLTFSENVQAGTGNLQVFEVAGGPAVFTIDLSTVTFMDDTITVTLPAALTSLTEYRVQVPAGAIEDLGGNPFAGINAPTVWTFTTADGDMPVALAFSPTVGETFVPVDAPLTVTFDEPIQAGTGTITVIDNTDMALFTVDVSTAIIADDMLAISLPADLGSLADYYVQIDAGAVEDLAGNPFAGISDTTTWTFSTLDVDAPIITTLNPTNNATNVDVTTTLSVTFDENVQAGTGNIELYTLGNPTPVETFDVTTAATFVDGTVTVDPTGDFVGETTYYVLIDPGAISNTTANLFGGIAEDTVWRFTTTDATAPTLVDFTPADESTAISSTPTLTLTFDEPVQAGTGNLIIADAGGTPAATVDLSMATFDVDMVTVSLSTPLAGETTYNVQIDPGTIADLTGNAFAGIADDTTWNFTTADATAPTLLSVTPTDESTDVAVNTLVVLTFDEAVQAGAGNLTIYEGDGTPFATIAAADAAIADDMVTVSPPSNLDSLTDYYVLVDLDAFADTSGNPFAGVLDPTTWNFTTADANPPVITTLNPVNNAVNVPVDTDLTVTFDENVVAGSGNIDIFELGGTSFATIAIGDATIVDDTVTVTLPTNLDSATTYYVNIDSGALTDAGGNAFGGISDTTTWRFTSLDTAPPFVTALNPSDNSIAVSIGTQLRLTFNEPVQPGSSNVTIVNASTGTPVDVIPSASAAISDNMVTITPSSDLPIDTAFYITVDNGAFEDFAGNPYAGFSNVTRWNFETSDGLAPAITALSPVNGSSQVPIDGDLALTFNEPVFAGTGDVRVFSAAGLTETIPAGSLGFSGNTVTIDPTSNLANDTSYYVLIDDGSIVDVDGMAFPGIVLSSTWGFRTTRPAIGIAKSAETSVDMSAFDVTFTVRVENLGDVPLSNVQITDNLGVFYVGSTLQSSDISFGSGSLTANNNYDGLNDTNLLAGIDTLAVGETKTIRFSLSGVQPTSINSFQNRATVRATDGISTVTDLSDDGTNPDPNGNNRANEATENDLTVIELESLTLDADLIVDLRAADDTNNDGFASPGEVLRYTATVTNTSSILTAPSVRYVDTLDSNVTLVSVNGATNNGTGTVDVNLGDIAPGGSASFTYRVRLLDVLTPASTDEIRSRGTVSTAQVSNLTRTDDPRTPATDATTIAARNTVPELDVTKSTALRDDADDSGSVTPGDSLRYTVTVTNIGGTEATNLEIVDAVTDANLSLTDATVRVSRTSVPTPTIDISGDTVTVGVTQLPAGTSVSVIIDAAVTDDNPGARSVRNQATVSADSIADLISDDPATTRRDDPTVNALDGGAQLSASKSVALVRDRDGNGSPSPGDRLQYRIVVENIGAADAQNVVLVDAIDENATLVNSSVVATLGTVDTTDGDLTVNFGTLSDDVIITYLVDIASPLVTTTNQISNQGVLTSDNAPDAFTDDPAQPGSDDPTLVMLVSAPELRVEKTGARASNTITYTVTIFNDGDGTATGLTFSDTASDINLNLVPGSVSVPAGASVIEDSLVRLRLSLADLAPGASVAFTFDATLADPLIGNPASVANQGSADADGIGAVDSDDPSTDIPNDPTRLALGSGTITIITEKAEFIEPLGPGDRITYNLSVTNTGAETAVNLTISDLLDDPSIDDIFGPIDANTFEDREIDVLRPASGGYNITVDELPPGETVNISFSVILTDPLPPDAIEVVSQARVVGDNIGEVFSEVVRAPLGSNTTVDATLLDAGIARPGDVVFYTASVVNTGANDARNATYTDSLNDRNLSLVPGTVNVSAGTIITGNDNGDTTVVVDLGDIPPDEAVTITYRARVAEDIPDGTTRVVAQAMVTGDNFPDTTTRDASAAGRTVTALVVPRFSDLNARLSAPTQVVPGGRMLYTLEATNTEDGVLARDVIAEIPLPADVTFDEAQQGNCSVDGDTVTCNVGGVDPGTAVTVSFFVAVDAGVAVGTEIEAQAEITSRDEETPQDSNTVSTDVVDTLTMTDIAVTVDDGRTALVSGNDAAGSTTTTYEIDVLNTGLDVSDLAVDITLPTEFEEAMIEWECAATGDQSDCPDIPDGTTYSLSLDDVSLVDAGGFQFTVEARILPVDELPSGPVPVTVEVIATSADDPDGEDNNNTARDTNGIIYDPPSGEKTGTADGNIITWTQTWINNDALTATGVTIVDTLPDDQSFVDGSVRCEFDGVTTGVCAYDPDTREVVFDGSIGPDGPGFEDPADTLRIIFEVEVDDDGTYDNAADLSTNNSASETASASASVRVDSGDDDDGGGDGGVAGGDDGGLPGANGVAGGGGVGAEGVASSSDGLVLRKVAQPPFALPGAQVVFTVSLTNEGDSSQANPIISDQVPAQFVIDGVSTSGPGSAIVNGQFITYSAAELQPGETMSLVIDTRIRADVGLPFILTNTATSEDIAVSATVISVNSLPQTGETPWWRGWLLGLAGCVLLRAGVAGYRRVRASQS